MKLKHQRYSSSYIAPIKQGAWYVTSEDPHNPLNSTPYANKMEFLLKNKVIIIKIWNMDKEVILNHIANIINERACGAQYEEAGWGIEHGTVEPQETKQESSSLINELERLGNIYEKGLLTEEEFKAMKKKLIGENYEE